MDLEALYAEIDVDGVKEDNNERRKKMKDGAYNLRGEVKGSSKLEFDRKISDYSVPKKKEKVAGYVVSEPPRSTEE
jgi:hypothetical protein